MPFIRKDDVPFKCDVCGKYFTKDEDSMYHKKLHVETIYECDLCPTKYRGKYQFNRHYREHTEEPLPRRKKKARKQESTPLFKCDICLDFCNTERSLFYHTRMHKQAENRPYDYMANMVYNVRPFKCSLCPKKFFFPTDLDRHLEIHTGKKPFQCSVCQENLISQHELNVHMQRHGGEEKFDKKTKRHDKEVHCRTKKLFECDVCDEKFKKKSSLNSHYTVHTSNKEYIECFSCPKKYEVKSRLISHGHELKQFQCNVCQKKFATNLGLIRHCKALHEEKQCDCSFCNGKFSTQFDLNKHFKQHSAQRNFECAVCQAKFAILKDMLTHKYKIHGGNKSKQGSFESKTLLNNHVQDSEMHLCETKLTGEECSGTGMDAYSVDIDEIKCEVKEEDLQDTRK